MVIRPHWITLPQKIFSDPKTNTAFSCDAVLVVYTIEIFRGFRILKQHANLKNMKHYGDSSKHWVFFISNIFLTGVLGIFAQFVNKKMAFLKRLYRQFDLNKGIPKRVNKLASHHFPESHIFLPENALIPPRPCYVVVAVC